MDPNSIMQALTLAMGHQWMPLAVLVVGWLVMACSDTSKLPISIPDRFKPLLVLVLGQVYAVLEAVQGGSAWQAAVWHGLVVAFTTMGLFDVLVKAIFNGNLPTWLQWVTLIDPSLAALKRVGPLPAAPLFGFRKVPEKKQ